MRTAEQIIVAAIEVLQRQLPPDSGITAKEAISELWGVLDGPEAQEIYDAEMSRRVVAQRPDHLNP